MKKRFGAKNNVLLVNITRLGDMLQATPTIAGMKRENPSCKVTVLVEKQFESVCHVLPNIDEVLSLDLGMTVRSLAREQEGIIDAYEYVDEFVGDLRARNFDYCLNMSSSAYTALLLRLVGIGRNGGWTADEEGYRVIESEWAKLFASSVFHQNRQFNALNLVDVFRCSADVDDHPRSLLINVEDSALNFCRSMLGEAGFTNQGPIIAIQAGASQDKRQWNPDKFVRLIGILTRELKARVVLTGSSKELPIIQRIKDGSQSENVFIAAGKTSIAELAALLRLSDILITGDTGPMHMSVAVGTPVIAMFLASAFGFETGPYSEGNIVLQPVIPCGPCNPNKPCAGLECHDSMSPELIAALTKLRLESDFRDLPQGLADPRQVVVYRSCFDKFGFCDLQVLNESKLDYFKPYRDAYRRVWLDDLGGFSFEEDKPNRAAALSLAPQALEGLDLVVERAGEGQRLISELLRLIKDPGSPTKRLSEVNQRLGVLDREIEQIGFHYGYLGPITRMFIFGKENLSGTEALELASQMESIYQSLARRCQKLVQYWQG